MFNVAHFEVRSPFSILLLVSIITLFYTIDKKRRDKYTRNPKGLPLPPGPKGWPILGILFDMPARDAWVTYGEWSKVYGDMFYFEVLGQKYLVLNSFKTANDLFEKRSSNYSDRVKMPMLIDLMRWDYNMAVLPYGSWWRRHRRGFNEHFHPNAVQKYQPTQARETRAFLYRLLTSPDNFMHHIRHTFAATIMSVAYGITIKESEDPYISRAEVALDGFAAAGIPGSFMVDFFPILKYIPAWFPGAGFKRKAQYWREVNKAVTDIPFERVEEEMKAGIAPPSISASLIEHLPPVGDSEREDERTIAKDVAALAYIGGADTTVSSVQTFFLAMALNPHVMKKAHEEIDRVVGPNRLPDFNDRKDLPYINALVKETMRWNLVIPLGVPHATTADDEYEGYYIPKGTIVVGNAWYILHDPKVFDDPLAYNPDRYLKDGQINPEVRDPICGAFGYGRRICPGRHMSDNSLYSLISCVIAVYDIKERPDKSGKRLKAEFTSGALTYPVPFKCDITPRNSVAEALIYELAEIVDQ